MPLFSLSLVLYSNPNTSEQMYLYQGAEEYCNNYNGADSGLTENRIWEP